VEADEAAVREDVRVVFSGEEGGGRYLDLHTHFHRFVNAKFGRQLDYMAFVLALLCTEDVPRALRLGLPYRWGPAWGGPGPGAWSMLWVQGWRPNHSPCGASKTSSAANRWQAGVNVPAVPVRSIADDRSWEGLRNARLHSCSGPPGRAAAA